MKHAEEIEWIDIQSAFYLLGIGLFLALMLLLTECLIMWCKKKFKLIQSDNPCEHLRTTSTADLEEFNISNGGLHRRSTKRKQNGTNVHSNLAFIRESDAKSHI